MSATKAVTLPLTASPRMLPTSLADTTSRQYSSCSTVRFSPGRMSAVLASSGRPATLLALAVRV